MLRAVLMCVMKLGGAICVIPLPCASSRQASCRVFVLKIILAAKDMYVQ